MKLKTFLLAVVAAVVGMVYGTSALAAHNAGANNANQFYIGVQGGPSFAHEVGEFDHFDFNSSVKTGYTAGGFLGYRFTPNWRADLTVDYTHNGSKKVGKDKDDTVSFSQMHVLVNGYYDFQLGKIVPYLGLGLGYDSLALSSSQHGETDSLPAVHGLGWQLAFGANYNVIDNLALGLGYRLLGTNVSAKTLKDKKYVGSAKINPILNSVVSLSLTYSFGG